VLLDPSRSVAEVAAVVHRSLDGRRFGFSGAFDLSEPSTSVVDLVVDGRLQEFTAGGAGLAQEVVRALGGRGFDAEFGFQGGTLSVAATARYDGRIRLVESPLVAVWLGERHSLVTHWYGGGVAELLGMMRTFQIQEYDDGLTVTVEPARGSDLAMPATVIKLVPGLGLLELSPLTQSHLSTLPTWRGRSTRAGELFQDTLSNGRPYFVLAGRDTWATLVPLGDAAPEEVAGRAERLRVELVS
jgi:hypothetical protein